MKAAKYVVGILFMLVLLSVPSYASVTGAAIVSSGTNTSMYYIAAPVKAYLDPYSGVNPDATLRFWSNAANLAGANADLKNKYVGALYYVGSGDTTYVIITTDNTDNPLTQITMDAISCGGGGEPAPSQAGRAFAPGSSCWYADAPAASLTFSATKVVGGSGNPGASWYPAQIYAVLSSDDAVTADDKFVFLPQSAGWLRGSYSLSTSVGGSYDQATGNVAFSVNGITGTTTTGSQSIWPTYTDRNATFLAVGICNYVNGSSCSDTGLFFPSQSITLSTGVVNPPVTSPVNTKYYVINGFGTSFCIGPNLAVSISSNNSNPSDGSPVLLTATISNSGNVNADVPFQVSFYDGANLLDTQTVTSLNKGSNTQKTYVWDTTFKTGSHTLYAKVDESDMIKECYESDNTGQTTVNVQMVYYMRIFIDGVETTLISDVGKPYNITVSVTDSLGNAVNNANIKITEKNGISLLAPTQIWQEGSLNKSVVSYSTAEVLTNSSGLVSFTIIPTGNKMMDVNPDIRLYTGDYSMYAQLYITGTLQRTMNFTVSSLTSSGPTARIVSTNQDNTDYIYDVIYQVFSNIKKWFTY